MSASDCQHEPDEGSMRACGGWTIEYRCRKCNAWGSFGVDPKSLCWEVQCAPPRPEWRYVVEQAGKTVFVGEVRCAEACDAQSFVARVVGMRLHPRSGDHHQVSLYERGAICPRHFTLDWTIVDGNLVAQMGELEQ